MIQIVVTNCDFMSTRALADQPQVRRRVCGRLLDLEGPLEFTEHVVALRHLVPRQGVAPGGFERTGNRGHIHPMEMGTLPSICRLAVSRLHQDLRGMDVDHEVVVVVVAVRLAATTAASAR
jgi:hypothetical protein